MRVRVGGLLMIGLLLLGALPCRGGGERSLVLTATAYNSLTEQTSSEPNIGAWGDAIEPGVRAIAVSRDLIPLGLTRGVEITIDDLPGTYRVLDKMGRRWTKKIDIYMGVDVEAARRWGVRTVRIRWQEASPE